MKMEGGGTTYNEITGTGQDLLKMPTSKTKMNYYINEKKEQQAQTPSVKLRQRKLFL